MKKSLLLPIISFILLVISAVFFTEKSPFLQNESAFRMVLGSFLIFFLPGIIWGEIFRFKSTHLFEMLAVSFILSLGIEMILMPLPFFTKSSIDVWIWCLLGITFIGTALLFFIFLKRDPVFVNPLLELFAKYEKRKISLYVLVVIVIIMARGAYRWGEDMFSIDGEKFEHLLFIRNYFSLPLDRYNLSIAPGMAAANIVFLWEFLLAAWAKLIHMDPLPLFYRARFIIPVLGLSGMFFLVKSIFKDEEKTEAIFWGVIIMTFGWFMLKSPTSLEYVKAEKFRGVFTFFGTSHHADSAMEILIPYGAGLLFLLVSGFTIRNAALLFVTLLATFMWHPREFFQNAVYLGILGLTALIYPLAERKEELKRWACAFLIVFVCAFVILFSIKNFVPKDSHGYDEFAIKKAAISYAFSPESIFGLRSALHFPMRAEMTSLQAPDKVKSKEEVLSQFNAWQYMPFLAISALMLPVIGLFGSRSDKRFGIFYFLLWFLSLMWSFSMLLLVFFTYSEINIGTPRIIHVFSYVLISSALYSLAVYLNPKDKKKVSLFPVVAFSLGLLSLIVLSVASGVTDSLSSFSAFLTFVLIAGVVLIFVNTKIIVPENTAPKAAILGIALFFVPVLSFETIKNIPLYLVEKRESVDWFGKNNPFGFSPELITFLKQMPPQNRFLVFPFGKACIFDYAPQYTMIMPRVTTTILKDIDSYKETEQGKNPLFNGLTIGEPKPGELPGSLVNNENALSWLKDHQITHVFVDSGFYPKLSPYLKAHPENYNVVFENPSNKEIIVEVKYREGNK